MHGGRLEAQARDFRRQVGERHAALGEFVVGRFAHFAPAIWLYAGHTLLIALVGLRLVFITPHLEIGDHLRHRQISALLLIVSSLLAIGLSFVNSRVALWALALSRNRTTASAWGPFCPSTISNSTSSPSLRVLYPSNWMAE